MFLKTAALVLGMTFFVAYILLTKKCAVITKGLAHDTKELAGYIGSLSIFLPSCINTHLPNESMTDWKSKPLRTSSRNLVSQMLSLSAIQTYSP